MSKSRNIIKKAVYRLFGKKIYLKAYVRGKIKDIRTGHNLENEARFLTCFVSEDSSALDIGANYGHYSATLSRLAPKGHIYAFEPVPFTYQVLQSVVKRMNLKNVITNHSAVSDFAGEVDMTVPTLDFGAPNTGVAFVGTDSNAAANMVKVKTIRLDDLQIDGRIDFIKIDIEGHEPFAFKGMERLIEKHRPVILIEFSHSCLMRSGFEPADFASYLIGKLNYIFSRIEQDNLKFISESEPQDGYYFLIPAEKKDSYNLSL